MLRGGTHRPARTLTLDSPAAHSFLTLQSYPGEHASVSGAKP